MKHIFKILLISFVATLIFNNCAKIKGINLSKSEVKSLDTLFSVRIGHKFFIDEWVFYEKNICQFSTTLIRKKTYTGTWSIKGDSIYPSFFYRKEVIAEKSIPLNSLKKH